MPTMHGRTHGGHEIFRFNFRTNNYSIASFRMVKRDTVTRGNVCRQFRPTLTDHDGRSIIGCVFSARLEIVVGFDCKLISMSGPAGWPTNVALARVLKNPDGSDGPRLELSRVTLSPGGDRTFSDFDDEEFIPFLNEPPSNPPWQLKFALNAVGGDARDLGETIISSSDTEESTTRFHPAAIQGPYYELTYKVLPD